MIRISRVWRLAVGATLSAGLLLTGPAATLAARGTYTCDGGSIPGGPYTNVVVAGPCAVDSGSITVARNLTIAPGAALFAAFDGSAVQVGRNITVARDAVLVLGCEPEAFPCLDNPDGAASFQVSGNLSAESALAVLVHHGSVGKNVTLNGGGGGVNCDPQAALLGSPAYATFEDISIDGNATITHFRSCWLGFFRVTVGRNVTFSDNSVFDPDGNEVATNDIGGNLVCMGNDPAPQLGDSGGALNDVGGRAIGQCESLAS